MDDFAGHLKSVTRVTLYVLLVCLLTWVLFPPLKPYAAGLILGTSISLINARYMAWKIEQLGKAAVDKTNKRINLGFATRAATALLAVVIAFRYKEQVSFSTTLAGLFFVQLIALVLGMISVKRKK